MKGDGATSSLRGHRIKQIAVYSLIILSFITGCTGNSSLQPTATPTIEANTSTATSQASVITEATVTFSVVLPASTDKSVPIYIDVLDEVTGLALNPTRYQMQSSDSQHASISLPFRIGEMVKYRYVMGEKLPVTEFTSNGTQVRYRLIEVNAPMSVEDVVSGWTNSINSPYSGKIAGTVVDANNGKPLGDVMVCAGGVQTYSSSDGTYEIDGLPAGTHNLVAMSLDGTYHQFQQGAKVAENATTSAQIKLTPAKMVSITFLVTLPSTVQGVPVRIAGDLTSLGETFADLNGGINTIASRMPALAATSDGRVSVTLKLPAGADLHYKYTLGDGFWNAEHNADGSFNLRELIVPDHDEMIQDSVNTWSSGSDTAVSFTVTTPAQTPATDSVSIQLNPFGWTEPIPMWSMGNNKWMYILYSPLNITNQFSYRYCRNDQCDVAVEADAQGNASSGRSLKLSGQSQNLVDTVSGWSLLQTKSSSTTVSSADIKSRDSNFVAGVEFQDSYQPSYQAYYLPALQNLKAIDNRWVFLTPTWTYQNSTQPSLALLPGSNPLSSDLSVTLKQINSLGMKAALFPQPIFPSTVDAWWQSATRDDTWWNAWFSTYERFIINYADLAQQTNTSALVLGGDWLSPALPNGTLADGTSSGVPADAEQRWETILSDVRSHYSGKVYWALPYSGNNAQTPAFLNKVDAIYVLLSGSLSNSTTPDEKELESHLGVILDTDIKALKDKYSKPIILGAAYPSVEGSANDCVVTTGNAQCIEPQEIDRSNVQYPVTIDVQSQTDIYNALMVAINGRDWIDGFVSRGFYSPVTVQDASTSINGKPAFDVLRYWFSKLNG